MCPDHEDIASSSRLVHIRQDANKHGDTASWVRSPLFPMSFRESIFHRCKRDHVGQYRRYEALDEGCRICTWSI